MDDGITATTWSLGALWGPFLVLALAGAAAVWVRPWALVLVVLEAAGLAWRATQMLPDRELLAHMSDPTTRAVFARFWRHSYAAIAVSILVPALVGLWRWRRPAA